ncbi:MAG: polymer-forming cytoskeletal protein [Candidatus Limnocylindria bacterium]|nr:polymer-forming cytoskeletal protein [Candidatus Limnocylindria bacterium]
MRLLQAGFGGALGAFAGLVLGLALAAPLGALLQGGNDLGTAAAVLGALAGTFVAYRLGAGRPPEPVVASLFTFKRSRPDASPARHEPRPAAFGSPGEQLEMADPRRDVLPPAPTPAMPQELNALLGRGSEFDGKLSFEGTVRIDGTFTGEISTTDTLVVGESAKIAAEIACGTLVVHGEIVGNIRAKTGVELHHPARVRGDITTPSLMIEKGVVFEGNSQMESAASNIVPIKSAASDA